MSVVPSRIGDSYLPGWRKEAPGQMKERRLWRPYHWLAFLAVIGPVLAPLFHQLRFWPFPPIADFIYFLGRIICPLPNRGVSILGQPAAVCPLCYTALISLTLSTWIYPAVAPRWERLTAGTRAAIAILAGLPWFLTYFTDKLELTYTSSLMMALLGIPGGLAIGFLLQQLFPRPH